MLEGHTATTIKRAAVPLRTEQVKSGHEEAEGKEQREQSRSCDQNRELIEYEELGGEEHYPDQQSGDGCS